MQFGEKRFKCDLFFFLAPAAANKKSTHTPTDNFSAEAKECQRVQLTILRKRWVQGANLVTMSHDLRLTIGRTIKDSRGKAKEQSQRCCDKDNPGKNRLERRFLLPAFLAFANALHQPIRKIIRQMNIRTLPERFFDLGVFICHDPPPQILLMHPKTPSETPPLHGKDAT